MDAAVWGQLLMFVPILAIFYFMLIRPQSKKRKEEELMRNSLKIGDEITTIGGIIGKIVSIKEEIDSFVIETSIDRSKVLIRRWAVANSNSANDLSLKAAN
jgi:preprotein translocase subunit YajC